MRHKWYISQVKEPLVSPSPLAVPYNRQLSLLFKRQLWILVSPLMLWAQQALATPLESGHQNSPWLLAKLRWQKSQFVVRTLRFGMGEGPDNPPNVPDNHPGLPGALLQDHISWFSSILIKLQNQLGWRNFFASANVKHVLFTSLKACFM